MALIDTYRHNVTRKRDEIAKLTSDKSKEKDKIAKARMKIDSANSAIGRTNDYSAGIAPVRNFVPHRASAL